MSRRRSADEYPDEPPRRKRSGGGLLLFLLAAAALIWFLPTIITGTSLRNTLIKRSIPDFPGDVLIGSASGGWLSPLALRDVTIWDEQHQPIIKIPLIQSNKPLLQIAREWPDVGTVAVHGPQAHIVLTENSSNIEQLIAALHRDSEANEEVSTNSSDTAPPLGFGLEITDGQLHIDDLVTQDTCLIENISAIVRLPATRPNPVTVNLTASAQHAGQQGNIVAEFNWNAPAVVSADDLGLGQLKLASQNFPLASLQPVFRRADSDVQIQGNLNTNLVCAWQPEAHGPALKAAGQLAVTPFTFASPSILSHDQLKLQQLVVDLDAVVGNQMIEIHDATARSDLASLQLTGKASLAQWMQTDSPLTQLLNWQSNDQLQLRGQMDVAQLAQQLPQTMRLKPGTRIDHGTISIAGKSGRENGQRVLSGRVSTDQITGTNSGREIHWDEPIELSVLATSTRERVHVENLACRSSFLNGNARGRLDDGQFHADGDLDRLANQLNQFCDLGGLELAGRFQADGAWSQVDGNTCRAQLKTQIQQFRLESGTMPPWHEENLQLGLVAQAQLDGQQLRQIDSGRLTIDSGPDHLIGSLLQPTAIPADEHGEANLDAVAWPLQCEIQGQLETWLARIRPFANINDWVARGAVDGKLTGRFHPQLVDVQTCAIRLTDVVAASEGVQIREPQIDLGGTAQWDGVSGKLVAPDLTLSCTSLALRGQEIAIATSPSLSAQGGFAVQGDLSRIWRSQQDPNLRLTQQPVGQLQGQLTISTVNESVTFQLDAHVDNFQWQQRSVPGGVAAVTPWESVWQEPQLRVTGTGTYERDGLQLENVQLAGGLLAIAAKGDLLQLSTKPLADVNGQVSYDLANISRVLQARYGPDIRMSGKRSQPFTLRGPLTAESLQLPERTASVALVPGTGPTTPLVSPDLQGQASLAWDDLEAYGIKLGPQQFQTQLNQGRLLFSPLAARLGNGQISLQPWIDLNGPQPTLIHNEGIVAQSINITPEMCAGWFKYITPLLANVATAEGKLSVALSQAQVPLTNPQSATVAGRVTIESAQVQPGPMAEQIVGIVEEVARLIERKTPGMSDLRNRRALLVVPQQDVDFQMTQGRIYHRNLELQSGNVVLRSQGWVDVNQQLGMLAEIPLSDEWLKGPILSTLRGQTIQIPVHGSLERPQLDRRAVAQLSQQLIGNAAQKIIQNELQKGLQKGLERLLSPK